MGQSADATIAFGLEFENDGITGDIIDDAIASKSAHLKPDDSNYKEPHWAAWREARQKYENSFPVRLLHHGYGFEGYFLAIRSTVVKACWNEPKAFDPSKLVVTQDQIDALKSFCEENDIEWQEPKWCLMAHYA